jgi:excisionase family DNA binding protein
MLRDKVAMSVEDASAYTGIGRNTLRELIRSQKLPVLRIGRKILIRTDTLDNFLRINDGRDLRNAAEAFAAK